MLEMSAIAVAVMITTLGLIPWADADKDSWSK